MSVSNYLLHTHSIQTTKSSNPIGLRIKISKVTLNLTMLNIFLKCSIYPISIGPLKNSHKRVKPYDTFIC
jgi:hypothetical protein